MLFCFFHMPIFVYMHIRKFDIGKMSYMFLIGIVKLVHIRQKYPTFMIYLTPMDIGSLRNQTSEPCFYFQAKQEEQLPLVRHEST